MNNRTEYDIIATVTNDLTTDRRMIRSCETLAKNGKKVMLIGRELDRSIELRTQLFFQKRIRCFINSGPLFYMEFNLRLLIILLKLNPKSLISVDLDTILAGFLMNRLRGTKLFFDAHEFFTEVPELIDKPIIKRIWTLIGKLCIPSTDDRYTVSSHLADKLMEKYKYPFKVIMNVPILDHQKITINKSSETFVICYLGVLNKGRGLESIIKAMDKLESCELWLIGEGDISNKLTSLYNSSQFSKRIVFYGELLPKQFNELLNRSHIGINLLENKSKSYYNSLANKFFDYLHHGLPILTMNYPAYHQILSKYKCGIMLDKLSTESIVEAVNTFRQPEIYNGFVDNCQKARMNYNWDIESTKLLEIIN